MCFAAGTRIMTDHGEVPVEALRPGRRVLTLTGEGAPLKPVRWVGRRRADAGRHPRPDEIHPIRIKPDAFGGRVPHRDLLVSPGHALFVDGILIPAHRLANDVTIVRDRTVSVIEYFHIELDAHDIVLAEGLPAESYLDGGNRAFFENGGFALALHAGPDGEIVADGRCAPLHAKGEPVIAVKRKLIERVTALGFRGGRRAEPRLEIDGQAIGPSAVDGNVHRFALPDAYDQVRLVSNSAVAADISAESFDERRLGVAVQDLRHVADAAWTAIALDALDGAGWHRIERLGDVAWRWTDGNAAVPVRGPGVLEVTIRAEAPRWLPPKPETGQRDATV